METISKIKRKLDGVELSCYFRCGTVSMDSELDGASYWVSRNSTIEVDLAYIDSALYGCVESVMELG